MEIQENFRSKTGILFVIFFLISGVFWGIFNLNGAFSTITKTIVLSILFLLQITVIVFCGLVTKSKLTALFPFFFSIFFGLVVLNSVAVGFFLTGIPNAILLAQIQRNSKNFLKIKIPDIARRPIKIFILTFAFFTCFFFSTEILETVEKKVPIFLEKVYPKEIRAGEKIIPLNEKIETLFDDEIQKTCQMGICPEEEKEKLRAEIWKSIDASFSGEKIPKNKKISEILSLSLLKTLDQISEVTSKNKILESYGIKSVSPETIFGIITYVSLFPLFIIFSMIITFFVNILFYITWFSGGFYVVKEDAKKQVVY